MSLVEPPYFWSEDTGRWYSDTGWGHNEDEADLLAIDPNHPKGHIAKYWKKATAEAIVSLDKKMVKYRVKMAAEKEVEETRGQKIKDEAEELIELREHRRRLEAEIKVIRNQGVVWAFITLVLIAILISQLIG